MFNTNITTFEDSRIMIITITCSNDPNPAKLSFYNQVIDFSQFYGCFQTPDILWHHFDQKYGKKVQLSKNVKH